MVFESNYLKYGVEEPDKESLQLYLLGFRNKPIYVWYVTYDGEIRKYVGNDVKVVDSGGSHPQIYRETYQWLSDTGSVKSVSSRKLGEFLPINRTMCTFIDDDEVALNHLENSMNYVLEKSYRDFQNNIIRNHTFYKELENMRKDLGIEVTKG